MRSFATSLAAVGMIALAGCSEAVPVSDEPTPVTYEVDAAKLDPLVDGYVDQGQVPLLYVRVEDRQGRVVYERAAQNDDLVTDGPIGGDTWFRIWSMSKIITITAALDMVEDGLLKFDDPVAKFIPEFAILRVAVDSEGEPLAKTAYGASESEDTQSCPFETVPATRQMTVRDLLNHKAGFFYNTGQPCVTEALAQANLGDTKDSEALIDALASLPLIQQPGDDYFYGFNTSVLGLVMERACGLPLDQIIEERITEPLGISGLRYGLPEGATLQPRFGGRDGELQVIDASELDIFASPPPDYDPDQPLYLGGEGMLGTTSAYADFLHMLLGRGQSNGARILDEETVELLTAAHTQQNSEYGHNGFNLWVNSGLKGDGTMGVGGLWIGGGYEGTHFWVDPKRGLVGLVMTQVHEPPEGGDGKNDAIREAFYGALEVSETK